MLTDKKREKLEKSLGKQVVEELENLSTLQLENAIVNAESSIKAAEDALCANQKFQDILSAVNDFRAGMRAVRQRQNALIQYSLHLLEEKGRQ